MRLNNIIKNKVVTSASWIIICRIIQAVCSLIVTMITSRYLGPSRFGLISYAASICTFFLPIMQLGLPNTQVNELVNDKENEGRIIGTSLVLCLISSIFCVLGVVSFSLIVNAGDGETIITCFLYSLLLLFQSIEILQYWFQTHYKFKIVSVIILVAYILTSFYKIILLANNRTLSEYALSYALDHLIIAASLFVVFRRTSKIKLSFDSKIAKKLLSKSKYYIIANLMIVVFAQTDRVMLKLMIGNEVTGLYSAAYTLANMLNFVYDAIVDAYRPTIMQSKIDKPEKYECGLQNLTCIIIFFSLIVCTIVTIFAGLGIRVVYGKGFIGAKSILQIVIWYTIFAYIGAVRNIWLLVENKQKILWKVNMSGAALNISLNYILIPILGAEGAAIASLITQCFTNVVLTYLLRCLRGYANILTRSFNPLLIVRLMKNVS